MIKKTLLISSSKLEALVNIPAQIWFMELLTVAADLFESKRKLMEEIKITVQQLTADIRDSKDHAEVY